MKVCTLLICCVLLGQNVFGGNDYNPELIKTSQHPNPTNNNNNSNPEPRTPPDFSGTQSFSSKLYEAVKESHPQNFVLSPLSLTNALAMVGLGAKGETAREILNSLEVNSNSDLIQRQSNLTSLLKEISSGNSGVKFVSADKIYAKSGWTLKPDYKNNVTELGGEIETVNFGRSEEAARKINTWVQEKTEGKIEKLVEASDLSSQTSLFVLNSIYFKGSWQNKFENSSTKQRPFSINESCSVNVEMMTQTNEFQHVNLPNAKARVLRLPYKGERLSMMIYLPYKNQNYSSLSLLGSLENWLSTKSPFDILEKHLNPSRIGEVSVSLPKFKIRSSLDLNEPLKKLGFEKMFDQAKADFSGIFNNYGRLFVSKVSQETFIEVNEEGTEAAAATGLGLSATSFSQTPQFKVDRPFLFQIVDIKTKTVLFSGRVKNPLDSVESTASAGQAEEQSCIKLQPAETSTMSPITSTSTSTSASQNNGTAGNGTNDSCQGNQKSEVEKLLMDFCNFTSSPNSNEFFKSNSTAQVARLEKCLKKLATERAQFVVQNKNLTQTVNNLEARIKEFERDQTQRKQPDFPFITVQSTEATTTEKPGRCDENPGTVPSPPPAAASGTYSINFKRWSWNATADASPCFNLERAILFATIKGPSCIVLYKDRNCTEENIRMDTTKSTLGQDMQIAPLHINSSKSIGVCS